MQFLTDVSSRWPRPWLACVVAFHSVCTLSQIHYSNPVSSTKPLIIHITSHDRLALSTHHGSSAKIALVTGREVFEWKCVWVGGMEKHVFMKVYEIMAGEDNWTAFTLDVSHSEALQWVHNCCHPGMLRVLEDKRVTAVIVLDTAVCAESTINPVHLIPLAYRWTLWMNRTMYGRTQLFMDISLIASDELADFQSPPKKQAVDSFTSDHIYTGICHMIDRCMHTKHIPPQRPLSTTI